MLTLDFLPEVPRMPLVDWRYRRIATTAERGDSKGETMNAPFRSTRVALRGIKYAAFASHETSCFTATVYIDGKKAGTVENDGQGGSDMFYPHTLSKALDEIATAEMQAETFHGMTIEPNGEMLCEELLIAWLTERDLRKAMKSNYLIARDGVLYEQRMMHNRVPCFQPNDVILNDLSFDEALRLYIETGAK